MSVEPGGPVRRAAPESDSCPTRKHPSGPQRGVVTQMRIDAAALMRGKPDPCDCDEEHRPDEGPSRSLYANTPVTE